MYFLSSSRVYGSKAEAQSQNVLSRFLLHLEVSLPSWIFFGVSLYLGDVEGAVPHPAVSVSSEMFAGEAPLSFRIKVWRKPEQGQASPPCHEIPVQPEPPGERDVT